MRTWNKKTAAEHSRKRKAYEKIKSYLENEAQASLDHNLTLEEYLQMNDMNVCFSGLHKFMTNDMMQEYEKNQFLDDGVYILLQGTLTYVYTTNKYDRGRKNHLFALAKMGTYTNLAEGTSERLNFLSQGYSILINTPFAVLEAENNNYCTNQDCFFLKIPRPVLQATNFQGLKKQRAEMVNQAKLPGPHNYSHKLTIHVNCNLFHTFKRRRMVFRNRFEVSGLGIVISGTVGIRMNSTFKKTQFTSSCILLPNYEYDVLSSELQLMEINKNPTILFDNSDLLASFISSIGTNLSETQRNQRRSLMTCRKKIAETVSVHKFSREKLSEKENRLRRKQFNQLSKQYETFSIVPLQFRKQNLDQLRILKRQMIRDNKANNPKWLFDVSKGHFKKNSMDMTGSFAEAEKIFRNSALIQRYEHYAKDVFSQYKKRKNKQRNTNKLAQTQQQFRPYKDC